MSRENGEYLYNALFRAAPNSEEATYAWADLFWDKSGRLRVEFHSEKIPALSPRNGQILAEKKVVPQGERWVRLKLTAYRNSRSNNQPFYLLSTFDSHDGFGRPTDFFSISAFASNAWVNQLKQTVAGLYSENAIRNLALADIKYLLENYSQLVRSSIDERTVKVALSAGRSEVADVLIEGLRRNDKPVSVAVTEQYQAVKRDALSKRWVEKIRAGDIEAASEMLRLEQLKPPIEFLEEYRALALRVGNSRQLLALAGTGDRLARKEAITRAATEDERRVANLEPESMIEQDILDVIRSNDVQLAKAMRESFKTKKSLSSFAEDAFKQLIWTGGKFDDVMTFLATDARGTLSRAYELAKDDFERKLVEYEVVKTLASKLFVMSFVLEGTGRTRSQDTDMIIARKIGSEITSVLRYGGTVDKAFFTLTQDYRVRGKVTLLIRGKENGERACGLLWMKMCPYSDEPYSESVVVPVALSFAKGSAYQTSGVETFKWDAVSGGTGLASGRYMGGTRVRRAEDLSLTFSMDSVEKM